MTQANILLLSPVRRRLANRKHFSAPCVPEADNTENRFGLSGMPRAREVYTVSTV
jgi:hypothetical protein